MTETMKNPHACLAGECVSRDPGAQCDPPACCAVTAWLKVLGELGEMFVVFPSEGDAWRAFAPAVAWLFDNGMIGMEPVWACRMRLTLTDKGRATSPAPCAEGAA